MYLAPGKYHLTVHPGGGITISQDNSFPPIKSEEHQPLKGLARLWCKPSTFLAFANELERQGYTSNGEWIGTARELRALYELLKRHKYVSAKLSRRTFFEAAKVSLKHTFACATSLNFADWDYQEELNNMYDSLSQWIRTEQNFDKN